MKLCLSLVLLLMCAATFAQNSTTKTDSTLIELYQTQKFGEAADLLKKTYPEPLNNKVLAQLAYASNQAGRLPDAEAYYQRLYSIDSTNLSVLFNMASIQMRRGNNAKSLAYYKRILKIDSTNFSVYRQLATLSKNIGDVVANLVYLQKANKINPENGDVAYDLSTAMIGFKQFEQSEKIIDVALHTDTSNILLLTGKMQVDFNLKKYPEMIDICTRLINNQAQSTQVINYKGIAEFRLKKYKECIKTLHMLDSTETQSETSYYYLGLSHKALKDNAKAIYYLQKAINEGISPATNSYYSEIGDCYDQMHLPKKALAAYQRGLTFGEKPMALYAMAAIYDVSLRDTLMAVRYYKKYISSKPPADSQQSFIEYTNHRINELHR